MAYEGFDAALAEDLAFSLGVGNKYIPTSWPALMQDTLDRKFDLAICGITITAARREQALMSNGYLENEPSSAVRRTRRNTCCLPRPAGCARHGESALIL